MYYVCFWVVILCLWVYVLLDWLALYNNMWLVLNTSDYVMYD